MAISKYYRWPRVMALVGLSLLASTQVLADQDKMSDKYRQEMMEHYGRGDMPYGRMGGPGWGGMGMMGGPGWGGMGMGYGMMGGYGYAPLGMLDLTEKQRELITAIHRDQRKTQMELMDKMMDEMDKIQKLMLADKRDPSEIGKAYEPVFILQRRMIESSVESMNKMEAVLTKQQKEELKKYRKRGMGYGMMGY